MGENDPEWSVSGDTISEGTHFWVYKVVIGRVGDDVELTVEPTGCVMAEPLGAPSKRLSVGSPVGLAPPATIDWVGGCAVIGENTPPRAIPCKCTMDRLIEAISHSLGIGVIGGLSLGLGIRGPLLPVLIELADVGLRDGDEEEGGDEEEDGCYGICTLHGFYHFCGF